MAACPSPPSLPQLLPQPPNGSSSSHSCLYNALSTQLPEGILKMQTYAGHSPVPKPSKGFPSPHMIAFKTPPHSICLAMLALFLLLTHPKQDPTQAFCAQPSLPQTPPPLLLVCPVLLRHLDISSWHLLEPVTCPRTPPS